MKVFNTILMIIGVIGILLFIGLMIGYFLYSLSPPLKEQMAFPPVTYESVQSYDQKVETFKTEIKAAVAAKEEKTVTLTITEEEINSKVIELSAEGKSPANEMLINFKDEFCWVYAVFDTPGVNAKIGIIAQIKVIDNDIKITVANFHLGKLPLPNSVDEKVGNMVDIAIKMQDPTDDLPIKITAIEIEDGKLIITGVTEVAD